MGIREAILNEVKEQGFVEGIEKGIKEGIKLSVKAMLQKGKFSLQEIAEILDLDVDFVKQVKNDLDLA
jgi:predicted transposase/invertase (TIGR01784 family)